MPKAIIRQGWIAPAAVAMLAALVYVVAGAAAACIVIAVGAAAIIYFHVTHLQRLADWASGSLDADVPEGRGVWTAPFAALYRHMRTRNAYERDLRHVIERFRLAAAALPDGVVVLDKSARIDWANPRARAQLGLDIAHDRGQPIVNLVRQPEFLRYVEAGDFDRSIVVSSARDAACDGRGHENRRRTPPSRVAARAVRR